MNNNMNFDPMTGQPIQNNQNQESITNNVQINQTTTNVERSYQDEQLNKQIQSELQTIPNVEQNEQQFINNVQTMNEEKKEENKEGINFIFIIILFIILLASIYFLFPLLSKYI